MRRLVPLCALLCAAPAGAETLTVMSFNIWGGGANEGKDVSQTVAAIRAAGADVVGLQETRLESDPCTAESCPATGPSVAAVIAEALGGWHVHDQTAENPALWANAVISRHPIGAVSANDLGVKIDVNGRPVWLFNIHHDDEPYQPYQVLGIEYGPAPFVKTAAEAEHYARLTRGAAMDLLEADMAAAGDAVTLVTGDFNEPSHLDWTPAAVAAGQQPLAVDWPTTLRLTEAGFTDAYRSAHPDPVAKPAYTWTPMGDESDPEDHHDRIDFVFVKGAEVTGAAIVGETGPRSDIALDPWPADHRAVVATIEF